MVKITSESSADLNELFDKYGIGVIPLSVNLDGKDYLDGVDISPQDIFKAYEEKKILPKTAALSPENYKDFFRPIRESGAEIVHFALSSKITTNCGNAKKAGDELGGVYVVDTHSLSSGMGLLVLYAVGLPYMHLILTVYMEKTWTIGQTIMGGMILFLPWDAVKIVVAAGLARRVLPVIGLYESSQATTAKAANIAKNTNSI